MYVILTVIRFHTLYMHWWSISNYFCIEKAPVEKQQCNRSNLPYNKTCTFLRLSALIPTLLRYRQSFAAGPRLLRNGSFRYFWHTLSACILACFLTVFLSSGLIIKPSQLGSFSFKKVIISCILFPTSCKSSGLTQQYVKVSRAFKPILARSLFL